jgi:D-aspartate ligase
VQDVTQAATNSVRSLLSRHGANVTGERNRSASSAWPHVVIVDPFTAGLAAARRLTRAGARVTMLVDPGDLWVDRTRGVRSIIEPFGARGARWLALLQEIAASGEEIVALPTTDRSCELLLASAERLPANVLMFERAGVGHRALMDKQSADAIARAAGVPVPWTAIVGDAAELQRALAEAPWPCVVKPALSHEWRERYGNERVFLVADADEAWERLRRPLQDGLAMLLSQYIPGGDDHVEEAIVVRLADGSYPVSFGCHKLRQDPPGFGATTVGEASSLPETTALAKRVLDEAGFVGVAGVETKRHADTGERWFLEVNVRMPGQWGLGDSCGAQATGRLVRALRGEQLEPQPPLREGVRILLPHLDAHVLGPALRHAPPLQRPAVAFGFARAYAGTRNFGLLDVRDPGPGLAWIGLLAGRRLGALRARIRGERPGG